MSNELMAKRDAAWSSFRKGELQQAAAIAGELVGGDERDHDALHLLGLIGCLSGQYGLAERMLVRAVKLAPHLVDYHNNLATVLVAQGRREEAIDSYREAARLEGASAVDAHFNLVLTLMQCERPAEALEELEAKACRTPLSARELDALGTCYYALNRYAEAEDAARRAVEADPDCATFRFNYGNALIVTRQALAAEAVYREALAMTPYYPEGHLALANAALLTGKLDIGWAEMDWHWRQLKSQPFVRPFPQYEWKGQELAGKTLLVWMEQGVGDEIEHANVLGDVLARAGRLLIECDARLAPLFARSFPRAEVYGREVMPNARLLRSDIDYQINVGGLMAYFRPTVAHFPRSGGFLHAAPEVSAGWRARLTSLGGRLRVGISWRSKFVNQARSFHYSDLDEWAALFALPDIAWINLQYDRCDAELEAVAQRFGVCVHRFPELDLMNDLDGAAALTSALDLVIAPANSVTMMAGALGVPTWMATFDAQNWHMLGTSGHAFLPSVRIFPRVLPDTWADVFARMAGELNTFSPT